jgi:D-beta-D-heptose 7-phosphate kinase/D-beta-D-heptose 1-phosphate adenosyltransferase
MVDHYVWGQASRISPEAPVPVVREDRRSSSPGGAANTAANVVAMGAHATLLAVVGDDADGRDLGKLLNASGVRQQLFAAPDRPTTAKTRVMAGSHQVARIDAERPGQLPAEIERDLLNAIDTFVSEADAVLISDYAKGAVSAATARQAIETARQRGLPVVVDPKGAAFDKYSGATLITPNEAEARLAAALGADAEMGSVAARLSEVLPGSSLLITRGEHGMSLFPPDSPRLDVAAISHKVHDVTGAGDTVAAALVLAMAAGTSIQMAVRLANAAAAVAVQQVGVARVTRDDLRQSIALESDGPAEAGAKP